MPIDGVTVGPNDRQIVTIGDPTTASNLAGVVTPSDALNITGKFAQLIAGVHLVMGASGNFDIARSSPGIVGVPVVSTEGTKKTYSSCSVNITPGTTATDVWTIVGSASKTVRLVRMKISGIATAATSIDVQLVKRSSADTGGTATQPAIIPHDSNNPAATAVVNVYSANPTLGTIVGVVRAEKLNLGATGSAGFVEWNFGDKNDQSVVLRGINQIIAFNQNGVAVPSGEAICVYAEFVEDDS